MDLMGSAGRHQHPFRGACLYKMGACYLKRGQLDAAADNLRQSLMITEMHQVLMPFERARTLLRLAETLRQQAVALTGDETLAVANSSIESAYDDRIPVFWR